MDAAISYNVKSERFPLRGIAVGAALTAFYAWLAPITTYRLFSGSIEHGMIPPMVVALNVIVIGLNYLVGFRWPRLRLSTGELVIIFSMVWIGAVSFEFGYIGNTLSVMSCPEYFGNPENRWGELYLAYMPSWISPSDYANGVRYFYNGLPEGMSIPWGIWKVPFIWWGSLVIATLAVVICLMTILQEQWHDNEKLNFPMADIPLALIGEETKTGWLPVWVRSRGFWIGLSIPLAIISWNIVGWFTTAWPHISFTQDETGLVLRYWPNFYTKVDFFTIGVAYFAPEQVLLGLWLGRLLIGAEMTAGMKFGFGEGENPGFEPWSDWGTNTAAWQCLGSLVMFVLWGLWMGREHFRRVFRSALLLSTGLPTRLRARYRWAVYGLVGGLVYMAAWLHEAGMSWGIAAMFLAIFVISTLGMAKIIAESSIILIDGPVAPQTFVMQTLGSANIDQASMTALVFAYVLFRSNTGTLLPHAAFASRMGDEHGVGRGRLYIAILVAVGVAIVVAVATTLMLAYDVGAFNFQHHAFRVGGIEAFGALAEKTNANFGPDRWRLSFFGFGMVLMYAVLLIRTRIVNFWLHPIGLTFMSTSVAGLMTINFFLTWLAKTTLRRLGGNRLVERAKPFFLGLVGGHALGVALGILVDSIFFRGEGHRILTGW